MMQSVVAFVLCSVGASSGAWAKEPERYVRLVRPAVGCPSLDAAAKMADASILQDLPSAREAMAQGACEIFKSAHGIVVDETEYAVCVLAVGQSRCFWFSPDAFASADHPTDKK